MQKIKLFFKKITDTVKAVLPMLWYYFIGEYKKVPLKTIVTVIVVLIYAVSPVDLLPDLFPGIGLIDDLIVLLAAYKTVKPDLEHFKHWYIANKTGLTEVEFADDEWVSEETEETEEKKENE